MNSCKNNNKYSIHHNNLVISTHMYERHCANRPIVIDIILCRINSTLKAIT